MGTILTEFKELGFVTDSLRRGFVTTAFTLLLSLSIYQQYVISELRNEIKELQAELIKQNNELNKRIVEENNKNREEMMNAFLKATKGESVGTRK